MLIRVETWWVHYIFESANLGILHKLLSRYKFFTAQTNHLNTKCSWNTAHQLFIATPWRLKRRVLGWFYSVPKLIGKIFFLFSWLMALPSTGTNRDCSLIRAVSVHTKASNLENFFSSFYSFATSFNLGAE